MASTTDTIAADYESSRLVGLDLIRGLCALGVMVYHYLVITKVIWLDAVGTYGVYTFFTLSGYVLYFKYGRGKLDESLLREFFISRFFRIVPLFGLVSAYAFIRSGADLTPWNVVRGLVAFTPLAGVVQPSNVFDITPGGWSVITEWSFYLLLPLLFLLRGRTWPLVALFLVALVANYSYALASRDVKEIGFHTTFLFLVYFVGGMLAAHLAEERQDTSVILRSMPAPMIAGLGILTLIFVSPHVGLFKDRSDLLAGWDATGLMLACCLVVLASAQARLVGVVRWIANFLGRISFPLYLIHIHVYNAVDSLLHGSGGILVQMAIAGATSIALAYMLDRFYAEPVRHLGKRMPGYRAPPRSAAAQEPAE